MKFHDFKIAFTGAQCTGKTTLMHALIRHPEIEKNNYHIQTESVRYLKDTYGLNIYSGNEIIQLSVLGMQIENSMQSGNWLLDRIGVDSYSYLCYYHERKNPEIDAKVKQLIFDTSKRIVNNYVDLIVFLRPEFPIIKDGVRVADPQQQKDVDAIMCQTIKDFGVEDKTITPQGSVEERVQCVLEAMKFRGFLQ